MSLEQKKVECSQQSDDQTKLYERHGQAIFGYVRLHSRSLKDTEDLLLEIFLAALEHDNLSTWPPGDQLAWLRWIADNKLANVYHRDVKHPQIALDAIGEAIGTTEEPEQFFLQKEERRELLDAINQLPLLQQHILQLRYANGLRCPDIAFLLNKREGAVRRMLSRCIISLRQVYAQTEGENLC